MRDSSAASLSTMALQGCRAESIGGFLTMNTRIRAVTLAALSALTVGALSASGAQADVLSLLPGSCGNQPESQPFAPWGDYNNYTPVAGGSFQPGSVPWTLSGDAGVVSGTGSFSSSLSLPGGSSATSPASCTNIYHPTLRMFLLNTGSPSSKLTVQALYPGLLGSVQTATIGELTGSSTWEPSPAMTLTLSNLLATLSLDQTAVAFRFTPSDSTGDWQIDDVYLDPYGRG
jgi:hypothetical protein